MTNLSDVDCVFQANATGIDPECISLFATGEIDNAGLPFDDGTSNTNLTVIPTLAFIFFLVLVFLKIYKWYKEGVRLKARGDVEFGDDSEVNYGIIKEGDKEFCRVEIRSDTTSVYDTVNSFRLFANGNATCITPGNHDTVGSYRSLVIQRGDASHYDSVKSYKAFLKQVTQNKDVDVEVKLLENYPVKCKSAEHCVVLEEEDGTWHASKLTYANPKSCSNEKKKTKYRRASGDPYGPMRKRSASNPTYNNSRQSGASSLPSIHYSVSSDSSNEEETLSSLRRERKKAFEDRCKKISRSCSGGKLSKTAKVAEEEDEPSPAHSKRKRHYSADSGSRFGKLPGLGCKPYKISRAFQHELNNLRESISETDPKPEEHIIVDYNGSSSDNPDSSPSPCNSSVSSDAIESDSDDQTKLITQISCSDSTTFNNNDLASSEEMLSHLSNNSDGINLSLAANQLQYDEVLSNQKNCVTLNANVELKNNKSGDHHDFHLATNSKMTTGENINGNFNLRATKNMEEENSHPPNFTANNNIPSFATKDVDSSHNSNCDQHSSIPATVQTRLLLEGDDSEDTDNSLASNPRRVKRFQVTSVQNDNISVSSS